MVMVLPSKETRMQQQSLYGQPACLCQSNTRPSDHRDAAARTKLLLTDEANQRQAVARGDGGHYPNSRGLQSIEPHQSHVIHKNALLSTAFASFRWKTVVITRAVRPEPRPLSRPSSIQGRPTPPTVPTVCPSRQPSNTVRGILKAGHGFERGPRPTRIPLTRSAPVVERAMAACG